jgi:uncharacterized protein HemY
VLRVIFFLALVLAFAFGFAWLADRPGTVAIDWMGYQIELSAMLAMVALLVLIVVGYGRVVGAQGHHSLAADHGRVFFRPAARQGL